MTGAEIAFERSYVILKIFKIDVISPDQISVQINLIINNAAEHNY